jgi:Flp pilus assembly protein TadG
MLQNGRPPMTMNALIDRLRQRMRELRMANGANVTITFALATIPIIGFVGAAVDYSHANSVKTAMQAAADSTALMLSKDASSLTNSQLQTKANTYFKALFNRPEVTSLQITATYITDPTAQLKVNANSDVNTNFMGLMGFNSLHVAVESQVKWGNTKLRVALALDNTGSMKDDGKMDALKTATKNLLDQLKTAAAANGDVYVSIIPFVTDVNVGASNYNATWIDWTNWDDNNGTCSNWKYTTKSDCQGAGKNWTSANHSTWNGCVTDRGNKNTPNAGDYDTKVDIPDIGNPATLFPADQYSSCPQAAMPLSYYWTAMKTLVNNMSPGGMTNQAIGLVHGWQSLVGGGPYPAPPPEDPKYKYSKVIILLTDGLNTQDRWYPDQASIDAREKMTCDNVKAAGITLYTVQVNTTGDSTSTLLQQCASTPDKFFLLKSANQLVSTFQQIGTALSNLRIAE